MSETITAVVLPTPDQIYRFGPDRTLASACIPDSVYALNQSLEEQYKRDKPAYIQRLIGTVIVGQQPMLLVKDPVEPSSTDTAVLANVPFGQPIIPDRLDADSVTQILEEGRRAGIDSHTWRNAIRHVYLFDVIKALGVRDAAGRPLPVLVNVNDSRDFLHQRILTRQQKGDLREGDLSSYAANSARALEQLGYGKAHALGYSLGGSITHTLLASASNIDILSAHIAEPPTYKDRSIWGLAAAYFTDGRPPKVAHAPYKDSDWKFAEPALAQEMADLPDGWFGDLAATIVKRGGWRTALAMTHGSMETDLRQAVAKRMNKGRGDVFPLSLTWHDTSKLTPDFERVVLRDASVYKSTLDTFRSAGRLRTAMAVGHQAVGAPHLAGENMIYYGLMMGQAVEWAHSQQ
jgi:pimeloyl-ACP methyl ester carboxylesterase